MQSVGERVGLCCEARSLEEALARAEGLGYPVLVRAAYALGGLGSGFASDEAEMRTVASLALQHSSQLIIDKSFQVPSSSLRLEQGELVAGAWG